MRAMGIVIILLIKECCPCYNRKSLEKRFGLLISQYELFIDRLQYKEEWKPIDDGFYNILTSQIIKYDMLKMILEIILNFILIVK